jgi:hypothetical protein
MLIVGLQYIHSHNTMHYCTALHCQVKYTEIVNVCTEFLSTAQAAAVTIINELHLPPYRKTLQPISETTVDGRGVEGGRNGRQNSPQNGLSYKYESSSVRLKLCTDDNGLFNGSHEYAAKGLGGLELLGSLTYMKAAQVSCMYTCSCITSCSAQQLLKYRALGLCV